MSKTTSQSPQSDLTVCVESDPSPADIKTIEDGLTTHAIDVAIPFERFSLLIGVRGADGTLMGGILAKWYRTHGAVIVNDLWVDATLRGQGWGRMLMMRLEKEALERGCFLIHLDTFEFQARGFYEKLGYMIDGSVRYPKSGIKRYFLSKYLD
jgi:GNAT superfamily N-acetyltransferase